MVIGNVTCSSVRHNWMTTTVCLVNAVYDPCKYIILYPAHGACDRDVVVEDGWWPLGYCCESSWVCAVVSAIKGCDFHPFG